MSSDSVEDQVQQCIHRELYAARALFPVSDGLLLGKKFGKWAKLQMRDNQLWRDQARLLKLSDYMDAIIQGRTDRLSVSILTGLAGVYLHEDQVQDLDKYTFVRPDEADSRCMFELLTFPYKRAPKEPSITLVARSPRAGFSHLFVLSPRTLQAVEACFYALLLPDRMQVLFKETASPGGTAPHATSIQAWLLMKAKILDGVVHEATQLRIFCGTRIPPAVGARWNGVTDSGGTVPARGGRRALEIYAELHNHYPQPNYEPCMTVAGIDPPHVILGRTTPLPKPITPLESDLIYLSAGLSIFMQFLAAVGVELTVKTALDTGSPPSQCLPFQYTDLKYYNVIFNVTTALMEACPHTKTDLEPVLRMFSSTLQRRQDELVAPDYA